MAAGSTTPEITAPPVPDMTGLYSPCSSESPTRIQSPAGRESRSRRCEEDADVSNARRAREEEAGSVAYNSSWCYVHGAVLGSRRIPTDRQAPRTQDLT
ncbi:hypothetical protein MTO96_012106 [Rhipicephalus appendiculatus]